MTNDERKGQNPTEYEWSAETWRGVAALANLRYRFDGLNSIVALQLATTAQCAETFQGDHEPHHAEELAWRLRDLAAELERTAAGLDAGLAPWPLDLN